MYIKTVNTDSKYKCIVMRVMTRVGLIGGKDIGSSTGCIAVMFSWVLTVFTLALTKAVWSIFLLCFLD